MSTLSDTWDWLTDSANWSGTNGIPNRLWEHIQYSAIALAIAAAIALPIGLVIGHIRRGASIAVAISGVPRAIPTLGVLVLLFRLAPVQLWPAIVALVVLAIPPILANTVVGIEGVEPAVRDAAEGMGMRASGVLFGVEVPLGLPLVVSGLRSATSQVIATATIVAYGGLGGLGRFIIDGYSTSNYGEVWGGALLVAALALVAEGVLAFLQQRASRHRAPGAVGPARYRARRPTFPLAYTRHPRRNPMRAPARTLPALIGVAVLALAACGSDNSGSGSSATTAAATTAAGGATTTAAGGGAITDSLTVGSANFPENVLLAEIYGGALEAKGAKITKKLNIGNRETYYKAISGGELDLLPEYTNSLLSYVERQKDPNAVPKATNVQEQVAELKANLPSNLTVLTPSTAEDKDVIVCNKATTDKYSFKTLSDLAAKSGEITLGGPPEFATRSPFGIPGLKQLYNANFKSFVPLEIGPPLVDALKANAVNCGNLFSTNSAINTNGFTALDR